MIIIVVTNIAYLTNEIGTPDPNYLEPQTTSLDKCKTNQTILETPASSKQKPCFDAEGQ